MVMKEISIVIPILNESENIKLLVPEISKNIQKLSKEMNQVVKPAEIRALDNALRGMDKRGKSLLEDLLGI